MGINTATVQKLYVAFFNRPGDVLGVSFWEGKIAGGMTEAQVAAAFATSTEYTSLFTGMNQLQIVSTLYTNLFGRTASLTEANFWAQRMLAGTDSVDSIARSLANNAQGTDKTAIDNKVTASTSFTTALDTLAEAAGYSGSAANAVARNWLAGVTDTAASLTTATASIDATVTSSVSAGSSSTGSTFTLTTGIDTLTGTSNNDTFQGTEANLGALDTISGGSGTDNLVLALTSATNTLSATQVTGIETLTINQGTADNTGTGIVVGTTGITTVVNNASSKALIVSGLGALAAVNATGTAAATTVAFAEAAVTGAADALTLTVNGVTGAAAVNVETATATATTAGAIETVNLVATGSTSSITLATNDTAGMGTLNISGSAAVTVALGANVATDVITINAASATGKVSVTGIGAGNTFAGVATGHTITGGSAADTFAFGANYVGAEATVASGTRDTVNGGEGSDTISMTIARAVAASTTAQANLTSIENLTISDAWTANAVDVTKFTGVTGVNLAAGTTGTSTMTVNSGTAVTLAGDTINDAITTFAVTGVGVTDTMTLNMAGFNWLAGGTAAFATTGIETLNINTGSTVTDAAVMGGVTTMTTSAGATGGVIVVTGANAMTFTGVVTAASIDASASTGILTVTAAAANAITIKGGSAADVINGSASADLITGNDGADVITSAAGNDSIVLTETTAAIDKVVFSGGATNAATLAANGMDTITGFGATDTINVAGLGDTTIGALTGTLSSAAVQSVFADDSLYIINTAATAAALTSGGTAVVTDFTNMTQVAAFLSERFSHTASTADIDGAFVWNVGTTTYVYNFDSLNTANTTIDAAEVSLVGTITQGAALVAANIVFA